MEIFKVLKTFNFKNKNSILILLFISLLLTGLFGMIPIMFIEKIVNLASTGEDSNVDLIIIYGVLYIVFQTLSPLFRGTSKYLGDYLQYSFGLTLQNSLYKKLMHVDLLSIKRKDSISITNTLIEDVTYVTQNLMKPIMLLVLSIITFIIGLYYMINISLLLTLIILPLGIVTSYSSRIIHKVSTKNISKRRTISNRLWKTFSEGIQGVFTLRIFDHEELYLKKVI